MNGKPIWSWNACLGREAAFSMELAINVIREKGELHSGQ
jgi:hypothetical protein